MDLKYYGPFPIRERIGKQAYKPRLGDSVSRIYPVFHVSLLKPCQLTMQVYADKPGAQLKVENKEQECTVEEIHGSCRRSLGL